MSDEKYGINQKIGLFWFLHFTGILKMYERVQNIVYKEQNHIRLVQN